MAAEEVGGGGGGGGWETKGTAGGIRAEKWTGFSQTRRGARVREERREPGRRVWVSAGEGGRWVRRRRLGGGDSFVHREWREEGESRKRRVRDVCC